MIFDAHLDLAMNALEWNRDLTQPVGKIRAREKGLHDKVDRQNGTVALPDMRRGGICSRRPVGDASHRAANLSVAQRRCYKLSPPSNFSRNLSAVRTTASRALPVSECN